MLQDLRAEDRVVSPVRYAGSCPRTRPPAPRGTAGRARGRGATPGSACRRCGRRPVPSGGSRAWSGAVHGRSGGGVVGTAVRHAAGADPGQPLLQGAHPLARGGGADGTRAQRGGPPGMLTDAASAVAASVAGGGWAASETTWAWPNSADRLAPSGRSNGPVSGAAVTSAGTTYADGSRRGAASASAARPTPRAPRTRARSWRPRGARRDGSDASDHGVRVRSVPVPLAACHVSRITPHSAPGGTRGEDRAAVCVRVPALRMPSSVAPREPTSVVLGARACRAGAHGARHAGHRQGRRRAGARALERGRRPRHDTDGRSRRALARRGRGARLRRRARRRATSEPGWRARAMRRCCSTSPATAPTARRSRSTARHRRPTCSRAT